MTATNPADSPPGTADRAVLPNGTNEIVAACRLKPALLSEDRAQENLVEPHAADQDGAGKLDRQVPELHEFLSEF